MFCYDECVFCYLNFWVGSEVFWEGYVGDVFNCIVNYIECYVESVVVCVVMGDIYYIDVVFFLLFIVECLFSMFLLLNLVIKVVVYLFFDFELYLFIDYE